MFIAESGVQYTCSSLFSQIENIRMEGELVASYLVARDPSILAYNRAALPKVQIKFDSSTSSSSTIGNGSDKLEIEEEDKCINVYLRIKKEKRQNDHIYEVKDNTLIRKKIGDGLQREFTFSKILGPDISQTELFNYVAKPKLLSFFNGKNLSLFTYGASGSGKTFTIVGTPEEPGLIPRALEYIFKSISKVQVTPDWVPQPNGGIKKLDEISKLELNNKKLSIINATFTDQSAHIRTYRQIQERLSSEPTAEIETKSDAGVSLWVSFCEIYNEKIHDLLAPPVSKAECRVKLNLGRNEDHVYIKNLTHISVSDGIEAYQVLQYGLHNLNYASTAINSHSSRSHCIFTVKLMQFSNSQEGVYISSFNFCDLAGSERSKKTLNCGVRLKESNNINTSLLVLGRCINNVRKYQQSGDQRLIPFRESKLTQIFQKALLGHERLDMVVNISPAETMVDETLHTLNFSAIAKTIIIEERLPKLIRKKTRFSMLVEKEDAENANNIGEEESELSYLRKENQRLREDIQNAEVKVQNGREDYDNLLEAYERIIDERDEIIERNSQLLMEEREAAAKYVEDTLAEKKEQYSREIKRLKEEIEKNNVIEIVSSSEEDESDSSLEATPVNKSLQNKSKKELLSMIQKLQQTTSNIKPKVVSTEDLNAEYLDITLLDEAIEENRNLKEQALRYQELYEETMIKLVKLREGINDVKFSSDS